MKTLGLIGGASWVSTVEYYRLLNEEVSRRLGGHEAIRCILYSMNFGDVMRAKAGDPEQLKVRQMVVGAAGSVARAGAEGLIICANTMHWFADDVERATGLPLIHIATAAGERVLGAGLQRVAVLGTRPTMEREFYRARLEEMGIGVLVPDEAGRDFVDRAIYDELVKGCFRAEVKARFIEIIDELGARGAQGVVLGCTEIPLLVKQADSRLPLFDTLGIHVQAAVDFALS